MNTFLLSIGWWNFIGSFMMLAFLNEGFGQKVLNEWTQIFNEKFILNYWTKLWLFWATGLNIFFGLINIVAANWSFEELKIFLVWADLIAYLVFLMLAVWGYKSKKLGQGAYSVFLIFSCWIIWSILVLQNN